jgi:hypothetical protein
VAHALENMKAQFNFTARLQRFEICLQKAQFDTLQLLFELVSNFNRKVV